MSDSSNSKAAKKNKRRAEKRAQHRAQKLKEDGIVDRLLQEDKDPVEDLKIQLQEAKINKDHKLAAKLRHDIWVMQDKLAGVRPEDCEEPSLMQEEVSDQKDLPTNPSQENSLAQAEKKLRNLKKKLQQIQNLKDKQEKGEALEDTQIAKIESEDVVLQEISELQELVGQT